MRGLSGDFVPIVLALYWTNGATGNAIKAGESSALKLRIVHTNDMHSRFAETSASENSTKCTPEDVKANKCYGGFARIATLVRQFRKSEIPTLFLNAGDTYQGTPWFDVGKWKIVSKLLNILAPNATCLGNHEFDIKIKGLLPFLKNATFPVVTANLNLTGEPKLAASKLQNSTILTVDGVRIGIIGYLTPKTKNPPKTGNVEFLDEVESVRREAAALTAKGVKILIALGHSGYQKDVEVALNVKDIDLVIGGHDNTFLYNGDPPDLEKPLGAYPTVVNQPSGRKVYVVQAHAYTKYLGNLTIEFDADGEITDITGNPILVNGSIEKAKDVLEALEEWRKDVEALEVEVGTTKVNLDAKRPNSRMKECNLGNFITDAMVDYHAKRYVNPNAWTDAAIAIVNAGSIGTSIPKEKDEKIRERHLVEVIKYPESVDKVTMKGREFRKLLEHAVHSLYPNDLDPSGNFLHFSGVQVTYDLSQPPYSRVFSAKMRCANCNMPRYAELENDATYKILMPNFMRKGGDGFPLPNDIEWIQASPSIRASLREYLKKGPVHPNVEERITYLVKCPDGMLYRTHDPMVQVYTKNTPAL